MKKQKLYIPFILLIGFFFVAGKSASISDKQYDQELSGDTTKIKESYLEMKGIVRHSKGKEKDNTIPLDSALITIYTGEIPYSEFLTNKKGKCNFKLPLNKQFKIEVTKPGFVSKSFEVDTKLPNDKKGEYVFAFDIDVFEEIKNLDVSVLKKPIAKVSYNLIQEQFMYDVNYTNRINFELKKMYKNYYLLQQQAADTVITKK